MTEEEKRFQELEKEKNQLKQSVDNLNAQLTSQKEKCKRGRKTRLHRAIQLLLFSIKKVKRTNTKRKKRGVIKVFWRGLTFKDIIPLIITIIFGSWGIYLSCTQNQIAQNQTYLQEADRRSTLVFLMGNIFDEVNTELREDYNKDSIRNLSPQLIGRIVAFSHSLTPYKFFVNGELTDREYSPERGQLLMTLVNSGLHKSCLDEIFSRKANFSHAYLEEGYFRNAYLHNVNLNYSNLSKADFSKAGLFSAQLREADICNTNFTKANLMKANLIGANLSSTNLCSANLLGASYRDKADSNNIDLWAKLDNAEIILGCKDSTWINDTSINIIGYNSVRIKDSLYRIIKK